ATVAYATVSFRPRSGEARRRFIASRCPMAPGSRSGPHFGSLWSSLTLRIRGAGGERSKKVWQVFCSLASPTPNQYLGSETLGLFDQSFDAPSLGLCQFPASFDLDQIAFLVFVQFVVRVVLRRA